MTKSNKAQMTTMQSNSITIVAWYSNKCMANYLNETDNKYCLILILNVRSDIWLCSENGILFHNIPPLNWMARRPYVELIECRCNIFSFLVLYPWIRLFGIKIIPWPSPRALCPRSECPPDIMPPITMPAAANNNTDKMPLCHWASHLA